MVKQEAQREQTASMEDYLEAIAMLRGKGKVVRVSQISRKYTALPWARGGV
jgi:hypothetical protein